MGEDEFVEFARAAVAGVLCPPLSVERGKALLYRLTLDNQLRIIPTPKGVEEPARGQSAFQTDLCVFEKVNAVKIPRVALEFKTRLTTHDVLTYSTKAARHKAIYPYLRYGLIISGKEKLPGRFFTHNSGFDFAVAAAAFKRDRMKELLRKLLKDEVKVSRQLEKIAFGGVKDVYLFRTKLVLDRPPAQGA